MNDVQSAKENRIVYLGKEIAMIRAKIEEHKVTKSDEALSEIRNVAAHGLDGYKKAVAYLFTIEEEGHKDALSKLGQEIVGINRDEDGLFCAEGEQQETLLYDIMPVYTLYETKLNKKEHYIDLVDQCKAAVKKYPGSKKIFMMLAEVLEYMSEEIYEQYKQIQTLLYTQYVAVSAHMYFYRRGCRNHYADWWSESGKCNWK